MVDFNFCSFQQKNTLVEVKTDETDKQIKQMKKEINTKCKTPNYNKSTTIQCLLNDKK